MVTLNYAALPRPRVTPLWQWLIAVLLGAGCGVIVGATTFEPLVNALARGTQIVVNSVDDEFDCWEKYIAVVTLSGMLLGYGSLAASRSSGRLILRALVLVVIFVAGSAAGLVYARAVWAPKQPSLWPNGAPIESVPVRTVPIAGSLAVIAALVFVLIPSIKRSTCSRETVGNCSKK